jgi:hypothetical protein
MVDLAAPQKVRLINHSEAALRTRHDLLHHRLECLADHLQSTDMAREAAPDMRHLVEDEARRATDDGG